MTVRNNYSNRSVYRFLDKQGVFLGIYQVGRYKLVGRFRNAPFSGFIKFNRQKPVTTTAMPVSLEGGGFHSFVNSKCISSSVNGLVSVGSGVKLFRVQPSLWIKFCFQPELVWFGS